MILLATLVKYLLNSVAILTGSDNLLPFLPFTYEMVSLFPGFMLIMPFIPFHNNFMLFLFIKILMVVISFILSYVVHNAISELLIGL